MINFIWITATVAYFAIVHAFAIAGVILMIYEGKKNAQTK